MLTFLQDEISMDHIGWERCLYAYSVQNVNGYKLVLGPAYFHIILIL